MPLAFLAMAQGVIVISGGVDLSVGAMMVLANCLAAMWMEDQGLGTCLLARRRSCSSSPSPFDADRHRDHGVGRPRHHRHACRQLLPRRARPVHHRRTGRRHVTGLPAPRRRQPDEPLALGALDRRAPCSWSGCRSSAAALGLAIYAVGSQRTAAFLSGVRIARTRVLAYSIGGLFAGFAGLVVTASTGGGEPRETIGANATLNSVAAVVLGGVALTGGVGGLVGPVLAAACLTLIPAIMLGLGWDPSNAETARGVIIILVVLVAGLLQTRRRAVSDRLEADRGPRPRPPIDRSSPRSPARPPGRGGGCASPSDRRSCWPAVFAVLYAVTAWQDDSLLAGRRRALDPPAGVPAGDLRRQPDAVHADRRDRPVRGHDGEPGRLPRRHGERPRDGAGARASPSASASPSGSSTGWPSACSGSTR